MKLVDSFWFEDNKIEIKVSGDVRINIIDHYAKKKIEDGYWDRDRGYEAWFYLDPEDARRMAKALEKAAEMAEKHSKAFEKWLEQANNLDPLPEDLAKYTE